MYAVPSCEPEFAKKQAIEPHLHQQVARAGDAADVVAVRGHHTLGGARGAAAQSSGKPGNARRRLSWGPLCA